MRKKDFPGRFKGDPGGATVTGDHNHGDKSTNQFEININNRPSSALNRGRLSNRISKAAWQTSRDPSPGYDMSPTPLSLSRPASSRNRPGSSTKGKISLNSGRKTTASRSGNHLAPGFWGESRPPSALSSAAGEGALAVETVASSRSQQGAPPTKYTSSWQVFEDYIKEIDDSSLLFANRYFRTFKSSDAFKQVLNDIDYTPPVTITRTDSDLDLESIGAKVSMSYPSEENSVGEDYYSGYDDGTSRRSPSAASFVTDDDVTEEMVKSRSSLGFRTPGLTVHEEDDEPEDVISGQKNFIAVAALTSDPIRARQELYQRYLYKPNTWADGLQHYFQKPVFKERSQGLLSTGIHHIPLGLRPKSGSALLSPGGSSSYAETKWATNSEVHLKKRIMSAYPTTEVKHNSMVGGTKPLRRINSAGHYLHGAKDTQKL